MDKLNEYAKKYLEIGYRILPTALFGVSVVAMISSPVGTVDNLDVISWVTLIGALVIQEIRRGKGD